MIDHVTVTPGYERALAAALGDDREIGLDTKDVAHWAGAALHADDPAPPVAGEPLSQHVTTPAALTRLLA